jgi:class 3 adenylate cyclase
VYSDGSDGWMEPGALDQMMWDVLNGRPAENFSGRPGADHRRVGSVRRARALAIHVGLYVVVNAFMVGTWIMTRLAPGQPVHQRPAKGFWPGWMLVTWGFVLGLHYLYVRARQEGPARGGNGATDSRPRRTVSTVLFTDIVGSTGLATELGDRRWGELLHRHDIAAKEVVERFGGRMVKTLGDGLLAIFEVPRDAILCAKALSDDLEGDGIPIRAGLHTGEVDLRAGDVGGIGVHIASRIMAAAGTSEILTSRTVRDLVMGSEITFVERGSRELKGLQGTWDLFSVAEVGAGKAKGVQHG